jgi:hypothetical protein
MYNVVRLPTKYDLSDMFDDLVDKAADEIGKEADKQVNPKKEGRVRTPKDDDDWVALVKRLSEVAAEDLLKKCPDSDEDVEGVVDSILSNLFFVYDMYDPLAESTVRNHLRDNGLRLRKSGDAYRIVDKNEISVFGDGICELLEWFHVVRFVRGYYQKP